jgi:hypothetical protein
MRILLALILIFGLAACGPASHEYSAPNADAGNNGKDGGTIGGGGGLDPGQTPKFAAVLAAFQRNRCLKCHSAPANKANVNLETYKAAKSFAGDIRSDVDDGSMPKGGPLVNAQDSAIIDAWVVGGMPE